VRLAELADAPLRSPLLRVWYSKGMESWWELGEWSGHTGNTMQVWRLTCPFCKEQGNFVLAHHAEKKKGEFK